MRKSVLNVDRLSLEIIKDQAEAKVDVPVFDNHYIDFLGLLKEDGNWLIVNKMYSTLSEE